MKTEQGWIKVSSYLSKAQSTGAVKVSLFISYEVLKVWKIQNFNCYIF